MSNESEFANIEKFQELADDCQFNISDRFLKDRLTNGKDHRDFSMIAANIASDRYSAGSTAAKALLYILFYHGVDAAKSFVAYLEHHEGY